jgi:hypothetical protein
MVEAERAEGVRVVVPLGRAEAGERRRRQRGEMFQFGTDLNAE